MRKETRITRPDDSPIIRVALRVLIHQPNLRPDVAMRAIEIYKRFKPEPKNG